MNGADDGRDRGGGPVTLGITALKRAVSTQRLNACRAGIFFRGVFKYFG